MQPRTKGIDVQDGHHELGRDFQRTVIRDGVCHGFFPAGRTGMIPVVAPLAKRGHWGYLHPF